MLAPIVWFCCLEMVRATFVYSLLIYFNQHLGETLSVKAEWDFLKTQHPTIFEDPLLKLGSDETSIEEVSHFVPKHVVETVAKSRMPLMVSDPSHRYCCN